MNNLIEISNFQSGNEFQNNDNKDANLIFINQKIAKKEKNIDEINSKTLKVNHQNKNHFTTVNNNNERKKINEKICEFNKELSQRRKAENERGKKANLLEEQKILNYISKESEIENQKKIIEKLGKIKELRQNMKESQQKFNLNRRLSSDNQICSSFQNENLRTDHNYHTYVRKENERSKKRKLVEKFLLKKKNNQGFELNSDLKDFSLIKSNLNSKQFEEKVKQGHDIFNQIENKKTLKQINEIQEKEYDLLSIKHNNEIFAQMDKDKKNIKQQCQNMLKEEYETQISLSKIKNVKIIRKN